MKRKILSIGILCSILAIVPIQFTYALSNNTVRSAPLSSSVVLKSVEENYGDTRNKLNLLEVDMNDSNNTVDVIFNTEGLFKRMSIKKIASSTPNVVAAANADFFHMQNYTSALGPMVKDHRVLASPFETPNKYAAMVVTDANKVSFEYVEPGVILRNLTKTKDYTVPTMNKLLSSSYTGFTIRTSDYAYYTFGKDEKNPERVEIIVSPQYVVQEIRIGQESTKIPYGGFALISFNIDAKETAKQFSVGDKVDIKLRMMLERPDIKTVIGGGSILLKDGQKTPITSSVGGKAQRTAVGVDSNNKLVIITNDGRQAGTPGLNEKDMQGFMQSMGLKDGMIFDGGGSTELYADGKVQNTLYSERYVINALAIKNDRQTGQVAKVNITPLKDIIYTGDEVEVVASAEDAGGSIVTQYNTGNIAKSTSGFDSEIKQRSIVPKTAGIGTVNATVGNVTGTAEVEVLEAQGQDARYKKNINQSPKFNIYANMEDGGDLISSLFKGKIIESSIESDRNLLIGNSESYFLKKVKGNSENITASTPSKVYDDTVVVSLNNVEWLTKNESQWGSLQNAIASASKNIIVVLQGSNKMKLKSEQEALDKTLEDASKGKNIYVVYKASANQAYKRGHVSYISIVDLKNQNYGDLKNAKYLQMYQDTDGAIAYDFKSIF